MDVEKLLDKYFEGKTTCEEECRLRRFFNSGNVPGHLQIYVPMFACLEQENRKLAREPHPSRVRLMTRHIYRPLIGIAAATLLCIGMAKLLKPGSSVAASYVIIDGKRYTSQDIVQAKAQEALMNVSFTEGELDDWLLID